MNETDRAVHLNAAVLSDALGVLSDSDLSALTMAEIARRCGISVDELLVRFPSIDDIVLAFYGQVASRLEERVGDLPRGGVFSRFRALMRFKTDVLQPHRRLLKALSEHPFSQSRTAVFSPATEHIRVSVTGVFASCLLGSDDRPAAGMEDAITREIYRLHLALVWIWARIPVLYPFTNIAAAVACVLIVRLSHADAMKDWLARSDNFASQLLAPKDLEWNGTAEKILRRVMLRRKLPDSDSACRIQPCRLCCAPHIAKTQAMIDAGEPIHMVLPAFPAKSPNLKKVLGALPDMGEELALKSLQDLCDEVGRIYDNGVRLTICSDGHVFSDIVGLADEAVTEYSRSLRRLIDELGCASIDTFDLSAIGGDADDYSVLRSKLVSIYADNIDTIRARIHDSPRQQAIFDGMHRFVYEDRLDLFPEVSKSQQKKISKTIAMEMIQRSNAWSRLVGEKFPNSLRLSIHPHDAHSEKIGIALCHATENWRTPWHGAILVEDNRFSLVRREEAEMAGATVVYKDALPHHLKAQV